MPCSHAGRPSPVAGFRPLGMCGRRDVCLRSFRASLRCMRVRAENGEAGVDPEARVERGENAATNEGGEEIKPLPPRTELSSGMKEKLRSEYVGLGGSENQAMGSNYFLIIMVVVAVLAAASKLTGAI